MKAFGNTREGNDYFNMERELMEGTTKREEISTETSENTTETKE
jgi:hypothetical protein